MSQMKIKKLREASGYTQQQIADELGVTRRTIINWEKGHTSLKKYELHAILFQIEEMS